MTKKHITESQPLNFEIDLIFAPVSHCVKKWNETLNIEYIIHAYIIPVQHEKFFLFIDKNQNQQ